MQTLHPLDARLRAILPAEYQDAYEDVQPVSMGSAGLRFGADGKVAWNQMWATFCDLAMAGGPPHKGMLLEPATAADIDAQPDRYAAVVHEICRGIWMVSDLDVQAAPTPGWVRVTCDDEAMAGWLLRAIVMENVAARADGRELDLPAAPDYRIEKEIKNVVTVIAKTSHYWLGHMPPAQQQAIGDLFARMARQCPLVVPFDGREERPGSGYQTLAARLSEVMARDGRLALSPRRYAGWLGIECPSVRAAVSMMRIVVAGNVLSRREGTILFLPVNPAQDPGGHRVTVALGDAHRLTLDKGLM